jgi:hypothetical protein
LLIFYKDKGKTRVSNPGVGNPCFFFYDRVYFPFFPD